MLDKIAPGTRVKVSITKQPTSAAAAKTLVRVLSKDRAIEAENKRLRRVRDRHLRITRRGGRPWAIRVTKQHPVKARPGESGTLIATVDVLRDLASVRRFIEVKQAR